ncbi:MAG: hypothetical protein Q7S40_16315 [Opitutaceae bacterium]|nr:hypothetical protein [Opitutaceae bacterium]
MTFERTSDPICGWKPQPHCGRGRPRSQDERTPQDDLVRRLQLRREDLLLGVMRIPFLLLVSALVVGAATPERGRVIGIVQPEIRLASGGVFKNAKVLGASLEKGTATLSDSTQIRVVPLQQLPAPLREQVVAEVSRGEPLRYNIYREEVRPPPPPPDKAVSPAPPLVARVTPTITDRLIARAAAETPDELKLHLLKSFGRVSSVTTKIRKVEQVSGWQKIRASGDAAFSVWDNSRRDYLWRTEKFEVEFAIVDGTALKLDTITFGGISRSAEID